MNKSGFNQIRTSLAMTCGGWMAKREKARKEWMKNDLTRWKDLLQKSRWTLSAEKVELNLGRVSECHTYSWKLCVGSYMSLWLPCNFELWSALVWKEPGSIAVLQVGEMVQPLTEVLYKEAKSKEERRLDCGEMFRPRGQLCLNLCQTPLNRTFPQSLAKSDSTSSWDRWNDHWNHLRPPRWALKPPQ